MFFSICNRHGIIKYSKNKFIIFFNQGYIIPFPAPYSSILYKRKAIRFDSINKCIKIHKTTIGRNDVNVKPRLNFKYLFNIQLYHVATDLKLRRQIKSQISKGAVT